MGHRTALIYGDRYHHPHAFLDAYGYSHRLCLAVC